MPPRFEWDEEKDRANRAKHGIGFEEASTVFDGPVFTAPDEHEDYGEERFISVGCLGSLIVVVVVHTERFISVGCLGSLIVVVVVHTDREGRVRLISARKASRKERQAYYEHLEETA